MNKTLFLTTAQCFGIPARKAGALFSELKLWEVNSGVSYVVKRMKLLKTILLGSKSVQPDSGYLGGAWGSLVRDSSIALDNRLHMLHVYLSYIASDFTEDQLQKFYRSMESDDVTGTGEVPTPDTLLWLKAIGVRGMNLFPKPYMERSVSSQKGLPKIPNWEIYQNDRTYLSRGISGATETDLSMDLAMAADSPLWKLFVWSASFNSNFIDSRIFQLTAGSSAARWNAQDGGSHHHYVGALGFIQEPGLKLRVVANPIRVGQAFLDPLKFLLLKQLTRIPADCTYDQEKGIRQVQAWIRGGKTVFSVDLSDATNLFPWHYQEKVMDFVLQMNKPSSRNGADQIRALQLIMEAYVKGVWSTPHGDKRFSRGQPLGLGPSFPLFALSHHCLLKDCGATQDDYVILGDDICLSNYKIHELYRKKLLLLGCKVSEDKCLTSRLLAEFGGKVITSKSVTSKYKWTPIRSTNVMDVLRVFGPRVLPLVPRSLLDVVPTLCTLPRYMGGCGWTPPGIYAKMVSPILKERLVNRPEKLLPMPSVSKELRFRTSAAQHFAKGVASDERLDFFSLAQGVLAAIDGFKRQGVPVPETDVAPPPYLLDAYIPGSDREVLSSNRLVNLAKQLV